MIKSFNCPRCGYATNICSNFKNHLARKYRCKPRIADVPLNLLQDTYLNFVKVAPLIDLTIQNNTDNISTVNDNEIYHGKKGYLYMLKEREFIKTGESIYKIGKTTRALQQRMSEYPKNSMLFIAILCEDCHKSELSLLKKFRMEYNNRCDIGKEYFEGDIQTMLRYFCDTVV